MSLTHEPVSPLPRDFAAAPGSATARVVTGVVLVGVLLAALVATAVSSERLGAERFVVALVAVPVVPAIAYLLAVTLLAVPRMRFHVGARRFEVRTLFGARMWPAEGMTATRRTPRFERRLFGTSMPGYATGWFLLDGKRTRVYATTRQDGVFLESADSRIFVTPADVPSMLEALHHAGVTSGRSDATRPPGGTMSELSSPGPIRWSRILIGTLVLGAPVVLLVIRLLPSFRHSGSSSWGRFRSSRRSAMCSQAKRESSCPT